MTFKQNIKEVEELISKGWHYNAACLLSEIFLLDKENEKIAPLNFFSELNFSDINSNLTKDYEKIINITSYGKKWDEDELLLIFTYYIKIRLLADYFNHFSIDLNVDFLKLNSCIGDVNLKLHKAEIDYVKKMINKNWKGINFETYWKLN
ncbi:Exodeoxyribonuclease V beta chain [Tenacibaculum sp. 190524A02b]|uniref:hypothetical protein n=1 Tax=Tenacibaculum vairaonense TaxID=3137860 RepID=UPI0032B30661